MATKQKPISKCLTDSEKLLKLDWREKCFYIFQKLHSDNLSTIKADVYFLKGELYPKDNSITIEIIKDMINKCVEVGILVKYEIDGITYLHDPQAGLHERLVGNMSNKGEYPLPPQSIIEEWQEKFKGKYTAIVYTAYKQSMNGVSTEYKQSMNGVSTAYKQCINSVSTEDKDTNEDKDTSTDPAVARNKAIIKESPAKATIQAKEISNFKKEFKIEDYFKILTLEQYIGLLNTKIKITDWKMQIGRVIQSHPNKEDIELTIQNLLIWAYHSKQQLTQPIVILNNLMVKARQNELPQLLTKEELLIELGLIKKEKEDNNEKPKKYTYRNYKPRPENQ